MFLNRDATRSRVFFFFTNPLPLLFSALGKNRWNRSGDGRHGCQRNGRVLHGYFRGVSGGLYQMRIKGGHHSRAVPVQYRHAHQGKRQKRGARGTGRTSVCGEGGALLQLTRRRVRCWSLSSNPSLVACWLSVAWFGLTWCRTEAINDERVREYHRLGQQLEMIPPPTPSLGLVSKRCVVSFQSSKKANN